MGASSRPRRGQDGRHHPGVAPPADRLLAELLPPRGGQLVELRLAIGVGDAPLLRQEPAPLQAVERGVERALLDRQHLVGALADPAADGVAVERTPAHRLEDEEVEGAGVEIRTGHGWSLRGVNGQRSTVNGNRPGDRTAVQATPSYLSQQGVVRNRAYLSRGEVLRAALTQAGQLADPPRPPARGSGACAARSTRSSGILVGSSEAR